jgi:hypothetical protein
MKTGKLCRRHRLEFFLLGNYDGNRRARDFLGLLLAADYKESPCGCPFPPDAWPW